MNLLQPWGLLAGLLVIPVIIAHILKPARRVVEVSSTWLWRAAAIPVTARKPWEKLRPSIPLFLQLLGIALLTFGLTQPVLRQNTPYSDHTVFIIDTSASMGATDVEPDRLAAAKAEAKLIRRKLPSAGLASIVTTQGEVLLSTSDSERSFDRAINRLQVSSGGPDIARAALVSQGLQTADRDTGFVLISDGQLSATEQRLMPPGTRFSPIGDSAEDVGIQQLAIERRSAGLAATITVKNSTALAATARLVFTVDGKARGPVALTLPAGKVVARRFDLPDGTRVQADLRQISVADVYPTDDRAFAVVGQRRRVNVQVVAAGGDNVFVNGALSSLPYVDLLPAASGTAVNPDADVVVFVGVDPPTTLNSPALIFAAPSGYGSVTVDGYTPTPALSTVNTSDPLLVGLDLSDVLIESSQTLSPGDSDVLVSAAETPLMVRGRNGAQPFVYWGFQPQSSNLPLDISFPVIIDRTINDLGGATSVDAAVDVGSRLAPPAATNRTYTDATGQQRTIPAGEVGPLIDRPGFWTLTDGATNTATNTATTRTIAANVPAAEQKIAPQTRLDSIVQGDQDGSKKNRSQRPIVSWIIIALLVVAFGEWLAVRRRVGVPARQWRAAQIMRAAVAAILLIALAAPRVTIPTQRVATVFAIDASDSLSPAGRRAAIDFVEKSLAKAPKSARAGVVVFGGNARVTAATQQRLVLSDSAPVVDGTHTDLSTALRLAGAVSPSDAARRVVLVSDGRRTDGDETVAADELKAQGIRVDTAAVGRSQPGDVAVASFTAPSRATKGERITLRANLQAAEATTATVTLKAGAQVLDSRPIQLQAGNNPWSVEIAAPANGVIKYSLEVKAPKDTVIENDLAFAATAMEGPARVLVLSGDSNTYDKGGNGSAELAASLKAAGLDVVSKPASQFTGLDDLAGVSAVVMVDVHKRELNDDQVKTLTAGVRELGVGLTVFGGTNSFGSGGYLGSKLEDLLPVVSEVNDPKRETNVGMAIIIDTSGSMGAAVDGKRTALDLAKAGAVGSARQLGEKDYIGVVGVDDDRQWVLDVQKNPPNNGAQSAISQLQVGGGTVIEGSLTDAAARLSKTPVGVRHIIVLSDGYTTDSAALIKEAATLRAAGYTVSVVGAGPDIEPSFPQVAVAGGGRYIPGTDFKNLPALFAEETQTVARNLIVEGDYLPRITSSAAPVRDLAAAPEVKGFQATTLRPTAQALLRVGDYNDPLVASWQAGLGKVTTWQSDGGQRWATGWSASDEPFWTTLVKDTMLRGGTGSVRATVNDDAMTVRVAGADWPSDAVAAVTVRGPDGAAIEVPMRRTSDGSFVGTVDAPQAGGYAVGTTVTANGAAIYRGGSTAIRGYSSEYRPGTIEEARLKGLSKRTGGRGLISPEQAFDRSGLIAGKRVLVLTGPLLGLAALGWLLSLALWRVQFRSPVVSARKTSRSSRKEASSKKLMARAKTSATGATGSGASANVAAARASNAATPTSSSASTTPTPTSTTPTAPAAAVRELSKEEVAEVTPPPPPPPPTSLDQLLAKTREDRAKRGR